MKIGIAGYGNIGRGVEAAVMQAPDMELAGIYTRREPSEIKSDLDAPVYAYDRLKDMTGEIDVVIICAGSATDLPWMSPELAASYNIIDSFDNHAKIPEHFAAVDEAARSAGKIGIISCGWDPGYFSLARLYADAALTEGASYTFWGRGVSQGHSDAIRRIAGVRDARQYTVPIESALGKVRSGEQPEFAAREMHLRECYVVTEEGADKAAIERAIKSMPDYFEPYDTTVHFISQDELDEKHSGLPHGGTVIRSGRTGMEHEYTNTIEYSLNLDSNPYFTASILAAAARAAYRMNNEGETGARTLFDVPPAYLTTKSSEELLSHML